MRKLAQDHGLEPRWVAFPLHPETPPEGRSLEEMFAGRGLDIPAMLEHLGKAARAEGLPFGARSMTYNSRRAQELAKWAAGLGREEAFHQEAFAAYFVRGENIYDLAVLKEAAGRAGLPPDGVEAALADPENARLVDLDWQFSREQGVTMVPTFLCGGARVSGAQPQPVLEALVGRGRREDAGIGIPSFPG